MSYSLSSKFASLKPSAVREILKVTNEPGMIAFAGGSPDTAAFPCEEVKKISAEILSENPVSALVYGVSEGYEPLRKTVKDWLKRRENVGSDDDVVIITAGGTQVMDITTRVLTSEGDTVICEEPSLNPGGTTMSLEKRKRMYELALQNDLVILEDNPYGNLRVAGEDVPAVKSLDTEGIVFYAGSFSKILAPGIRVAYAVIPKKAAGAFTIGKQVSDVHTGVLNQMIVSRWFDEYDVDKHIENIRKIYRRKLNLMCDCLDKYCGGFINYVRPQGGLFIWAKLPDEVDMLKYVNALLERKVAVVPGSAFMTDDTAPCSYIRLNFSTPSDDDIVKGVKIMGEVAKQFRK